LTPKIPRKKKRALVVSLSETTYDSRVLRQIRFLSERFEVSVASPNNSLVTNGEQIDITDTRSQRMVQRMSQRMVQRILSFKLPGWVIALGRFAKSLLLIVNKRLFSNSPAMKVPSGMGFDLVVCNDIQSLPYGFANKADNSRVIADLHEWGMDESPTPWGKEMGERNGQIAEEFLQRCDSVSTVSEALRLQYLETFGVDSLIVPSMPEFQPLSPSRTTSSKIELVHHGIYNSHRGIEDLLVAFSMLPTKFRLNLILFRAPEEKLRSQARKLKIPDNRLEFHQPVPPSALCSFLNQFDIEIIFIPINSTNHAVGLPNKLFEAVQARLAVVTGPNPEIAKAVRATGIGLVTGTFTPDELAGKLNGLGVEDISKFKLAADRQAKHWCFENLHATLEEWVGIENKARPARQDVGTPEDTEWSLE
jgi:glycosyltransferase involved in cell wall biosynthesis